MSAGANDEDLLPRSAADGEASAVDPSERLRVFFGSLPKRTLVRGAPREASLQDPDTLGLEPASPAPSPSKEPDQRLVRGPRCAASVCHGGQDPRLSGAKLEWGWIPCHSPRPGWPPSRGFSAPSASPHRPNSEEVSPEKALSLRKESVRCRPARAWRPAARKPSLAVRPSLGSESKSRVYSEVNQYESMGLAPGKMCRRDFKGLGPDANFGPGS